MFGQTPLIIVEDTQTLEEVMASLADETVIGVDTESDSFHHYQEKLCLIQLSDSTRDIIVDPLKVEDMSSMGRMLEDRSKVKILHGADYDVVCIKRDLGYQIHNIFDTMLAAQFLGFPKIGLADLVGRYFGHKIDKKYQRHDWARRPLEPEHLEYARGDTHWLLAIREVLGHKLAASGRAEALREECELVESREWGGRQKDPERDFLRVKQARSLDAAGLKVLRALWHYRDGHARRLDRPAFKVLPDPVLIDIARAKPADQDALHQVIRAGSAMSRKYGDGMLAAVVEGLADERPIPKPAAAPKKERRRPSRSGGAGVDRLLGPLKEWRNGVVKSRKLNPVVVLSNTLLREVARAAPPTVEALAEVPGVRQWQVLEFGEEIVSVVQGVSVPEPAKKRRRRRRKRKDAGSRPAAGSAAE